MARRGRPPHPDIRTPREWEVLSLLRDGLTNEQIAERLGVSVSAAKYHVSEILSKLGVGSREEAATWQPEAERQPWWAAALGALRPLTLAKGALVAGAATALRGIGVLAWGVLRTEGDDPLAQQPPSTA